MKPLAYSNDGKICDEKEESEEEMRSSKFLINSSFSQNGSNERINGNYVSIFTLDDANKYHWFEKNWEEDAKRFAALTSTLTREISETFEILEISEEGEEKLVLFIGRTISDVIRALSDRPPPPKVAREILVSSLQLCGVLLAKEWNPDGILSLIKILCGEIPPLNQICRSFDVLDS